MKNISRKLPRPNGSSLRAQWVAILDDLKLVFNTTTFSVCALFGGFLMLLYYIHINYLPVPDVSDSFFVLLAATFVGAFLTVFIAAGNILPALTFKTVIFGRTGFNAFKFESEKGYNLLFWFGLPFLPTLAAFTLAVQGAWETRTSWAIFLFGLICSLALIDIGVRKVKIVKWTVQGQYVLAWAISWFTFIVPYLFILLFVQQGIGSADSVINRNFAWPYLIVLLLLAVAANVIALQFNNITLQRAPTQRHWSVWSMSVGAVLFLIVTLGSRAWWALPQMVMRACGLGGDIKVSLVLNKEGQEALHALKIPIACADTRACRIDTLLLRSRLGSRYVLYHQEYGQIIIPSSTVLAIFNPNSAMQDNTRASIGSGL